MSALNSIWPSSLFSISVSFFPFALACRGFDVVHGCRPRILSTGLPFHLFMYCVYWSETHLMPFDLKAILDFVLSGGALNGQISNKMLPQSCLADFHSLPIYISIYFFYYSSLRLISHSALDIDSLYYLIDLFKLSFQHQSLSLGDLI